MPMNDPQQEDPFLAFLEESRQGRVAPPPSSSPADEFTGDTQAPGADGEDPSASGQGHGNSVGAFVAGAADMASFGFSDEFGAFMGTLTGIGNYDSAVTPWSGERDFWEAYDVNLQRERQGLAGDAEDNTGAFITGQVGGALLIPYGAGARGALQVGKVGVVQGAAYGFGSGEGLEDRLIETAKGGAIGGIAGATVGRIVEAAAPLANRLLGRGAAAGDDAAEAIAAQADDAARAGDEATRPTILGETTEGQLIIRPSRANSAADDAAAEVVDLNLPARAGATAEEGFTATAPRQALEDLQGYVTSFAAKQRREGDRVVDITWQNSPDVAKRTGEWRIGSLGSTEEAQALLGGLARSVTSKTTRSDEELAKAAAEIAEDIGEDPEALLALGREIAGKLGDADTSMMALRTVWAKASEEVSSFHLMGVNWATASDELVDEAANRIFNLSQLSHMVQEAKTGLGRGLRANKLPTAEEYLSRVKQAAADGTPPPRNPQEANLPTTREELDDWFQLWGATGGDPRRQADFLQGLLTIPKASKYLRQSVANFFTASILSAPRTIALNILGPGTISLIRNVERVTGAGMGALNPLASAAERRASRAVARYTAKAYLQTFTEIGDAFRMALVSAERNRTIIGGGSQAVDALSSYGPLRDNLLRASGMSPSRLQRMGYSFGNLINVWPRAFARLNNGLDEFSKRMAYQGEVRVNAMVEAAEQGLEGKAFQDFVGNAMKNSYDEVGMAANAQLLRSAERTTLTARVGEEGTKLREFGNYLQRLRGDIPELRFIIPIFNVPANALGETLRRLPIAGVPGLNKVMFAQTAKELSGELGAVARADAHGRMLLGTAFLTAGYMMNQQGMLTGAGPQNPSDRRVWLLTHQPYSIRIGGEWVRYDKFDILGGLLSIPATVADSTIYNPDDRSSQEIAFAGVGALAQWFKDRAALRTATGLLALGDDPTKNTERTFQSTLGAIASGFYPAAARTLLTDAGTNPYVPMRRSWTDYVEAALPFNSVEPLRNVLGEPIRKSLDTVREAVIPVNTVKAIGYEDDPVLDELDRLYTETGYGAGADTTSISYGFFSEKDIELESGMSLYGRAMQMRQEIEIDGLTLREALEELFDSAEYNEAVDGSSQRNETSQRELNRPRMVSRLFTQYNQEIKAALAAESPIAESYMTAASAKRIDSAYLRDVSVEELVRNPDLYRANGLDREVYTVGGGTQDLLEAIQGSP